MHYVWIEQALQSFVDAIDSYSGRLVNGQGQIAVPSVTEEELVQRSAAMKAVVDVVAPGKAWQRAEQGYTYTFDQVREAALEALGIVRVTASTRGFGWLPRPCGTQGITELRSRPQRPAWMSTCRRWLAP